MFVLALLLGLAMADGPCSASAQELMRQASVRAQEFDLAGAAALLASVASGCPDAEAPELYLRGLLAARAAARLGGGDNSLMPVRRAASALEKLSQNRPGPIEISRVMLLAAGAAALSERDEMSVFIDFATRMELLQLEAKQPPASMVSALELAADLWLQVHRYEEAERAYEVAARELGTTPRIRSGRAKLAAQTGRTMRACLEYRELMAWWGGRSPASVPTEIAEARAFLAQKTCASPATAPVSK